MHNFIIFAPHTWTWIMDHGVDSLIAGIPTSKSTAIAFCVHQMVSFMEGRLWISDNKASLLEIETDRDAPK